MDRVYHVADVIRIISIGFSRKLWICLVFFFKFICMSVSMSVCVVSEKECVACNLSGKHDINAK